MVTVPRTQDPTQQLGVTPSARQSLPGAAPIDVRLNTPGISTPQVSTPQVRTAKVQPGLKDPSAIKTYEISDGGAQQIANVGRSLSQTAQIIERHVMDVQVKVNATIVDDALNQARETARRLTYGVSDGKGGLTGGYRNEKGESAIRRSSGMGLDDEMSDEFDKQVREIAKNKITNPEQQRVFEAQVATLGAQLRQGAASHAAEQFEAYFSDVYKNAVTSQAQDFALIDPANRDAQKKAMADIDRAVATLATNSGASAQAMEVGQRAARGAAVQGLFDRALADKKYATASGILNEWGGMGDDGKPLLDANAVTRMRGQLDGRVSIMAGEEVADNLWNMHERPATDAGPADTAFGVNIFMESRGQHTTPDGKLLKSPKGAYGIAQLMPDTAEFMAKKLGRPELAEMSTRTTEEGKAANMLLGSEYNKYLTAMFKGDQAKIFAAYNAGPGWLVGGKDDKGNRIEGALKKQARLGGNWIDYLPQETQNYVRTGMAKLASGGAPPGEGSPVRKTRAEMYRLIGEQLSGDPDARKAAEARIDKLYAVDESDRKTREEDAFSQGMRVVEEAGGDINRVSPELRRQMDPVRWAQVQTYAKNKIEGAFTATQPGAYVAAMAAAMSPGVTLNKLDEFRTELSESDMRLVTNTWMEARTPGTGKGPDSLDVSTVDNIVSLRLQYLGINPSPKKDDTKAMEQLGAISMTIHREVLAEQKRTGQKLTSYDDISKVVDRVFRQEQGFTKGFSRGSQRVLTAKPGDIPSDTKARLNTWFEKEYRRKPSDAELLDMYHRSQLYPQRAPDMGARPTRPIQWSNK